jgi:hypothetical protein
VGTGLGGHYDPGTNCSGVRLDSLPPILSFQTWRQLWRVLEMSDIVLLITDIRHPVSTWDEGGQRQRGRKVLVLGFELRAFCLLGWCSNITLSHFCVSYFSDRVLLFFFFCLGLA